MRVVIERETSERRWDPLLRRKVSVIVWKRAWTAEVLYADRRFVVTRSAGSHQTFRGVPTGNWRKRSRPSTWRNDGGLEADMWGHDPKHPAVARLNLPRDRYGRLVLGHVRIAPKSVVKLAALVKLAGFVARDVDPMQYAAERGVKKAFGGTYRHVTYHEQKVLDDAARAAKAESRRAAGKRKACRKPNSSRRAR